MNRSMDELAWVDAIGQAELVRAGQVSPLELVDAAIVRIETLDPVLNALASTDFDGARAAASRPLPDGPLAGVPFLLKDLGATLAGTPQTKGSRAWRDHVSVADTELARRHRAAGLIVLGKTNTPEFGNHSTTEPVLFGPTRNPWAVERTAGGSSGGSAAAVASGMVPAAHGSDGAGSIRIPASCCGVVGLKPTRGRNSWAPAGDAMAGLAVEHALTRSVRDSAAMLDATAGRVPGDPYAAAAPDRPFLAEVGADPGRLRIAWSASPPFAAAVHPECARAARDTAELLASLGHEVEEAAPVVRRRGAHRAVRPDLGDLQPRRLPGDRPLSRARTETGRARDHDLGADRVRPPVRRGRPARGDRSAGHRQSGRDRAVLRALRRLGDADARPAPLPLGHPQPVAGRRGGMVALRLRLQPWNPIANVTGQPAVSLPLTWSADGLPIGSLIFGRFGDEATLFRLAGQLEAARPWADRWPPVSIAAAPQMMSGA